MRVVVTGAGGFIGREIVQELDKNNFTIFQVGRTEPARQADFENKNSQNNFFAADIINNKNFADLEELKNIDAVVHSAGLAHQFGNTGKEEFDSVNVLGTKNIVELAVKLQAKQFILISSTAIYGIKKSDKNQNIQVDGLIIDENTVCQPETLYAESKLAAENVCIKICKQNSLPLTILRLAPVIGEGNVGNTARLVSAIDKGRFIWIGKGKNLKTLIYKKDVARAVVEVLLNKRNETEIFNVAAKPITMKEFVGEIEKQLNKSVPKFHIPFGILQKIFLINAKVLGIKKIKKISDTIEKWLSDDIYAARKIKQNYNFEPHTSIAEAIEKQVKWYLGKKNKN
ncbi:MAG: NAD-dependent epimerase/dehydratase family protein [Pyrinomonadaceae bacterium]